jgi:hypothetical protein
VTQFDSLTVGVATFLGKQYKLSEAQVCVVASNLLALYKAVVARSNVPDWLVRKLSKGESQAKQQSWMSLNAPEDVSRRFLPFVCLA